MKKITPKTIANTKDSQTNQETATGKTPDKPSPKPAAKKPSKKYTSDKKAKQKSKKKPNWFKRHKIITAVFILLILTIVGIVSFAAVTVSKASPMIEQSQNIQVHAQGAMTNLKNQNLPAAKAELDAASNSLDQLSDTYNSLSYLKYTPLAWHYQDGLHVIDTGKNGIEAASILVNAIEPYADVLGLTGEEPVVQGSGTAEQRVVTIIETLPLIIPKLDEVQSRVNHMSESLNQINPERYPFTYQDYDVQQLLSQAQTTISAADQALTDYRPVIEEIPKVAGAEEEKTYIILFQNDGELRATGGFITAYAQIKVDKGKISPERSDDIYELDKKFRDKPEAPVPIEKYLDNVYSWNLRDMNLSPDFKESMDTFVSYYTQVPGEPEEIDGIIAVDTQVLTHLLEVLGPVEIPGYGMFSAEIEERCNCPQVVYALENMITRPTPYHRSDRKGVLGPLMNGILRKAYDAPSEQNPALFQSVINDINQKHILFYFTDDATQKAAETINVAGRIDEYDGDYFHLNDTNFSGAKSNMFVTQEVEQKIEIQGDKVVKNITVSYKNPRAGDNCNLEAGLLCLNGVLNNWVRFYVPKGSILVDSVGFEEGSVEVTEDLDKTVIEGFMTLNPEAQAKVQLTYEVPYSPSGEYKLFIQKQPGSKLPEYTVVVGDHREEFELETDKELILPL